MSLALDEIRQRIGAIEDPEIPVLTLDDLGIIRDMRRGDNGLSVTITPTYSGCPATQVISDLIAQCLRENHVEKFQIDQSLAPPWSSTWISDKGRKKLFDYGIAPPNPEEVGRPKCCPQCKSSEVERLSAFGSTPCQAIWKCGDCLETFNYFKCM